MPGIFFFGLGEWSRAAAQAVRAFGGAVRSSHVAPCLRRERRTDEGDRGFDILLDERRT
jgi:hypothetical protein